VCALADAASCDAGDERERADADGGGIERAVVVPAGSLPCAVDKVLAENCRAATRRRRSTARPMPMTSLAEMYAAARSDPSKKVYELVPLRIGNDQFPNAAAAERAARGPAIARRCARGRPQARRLRPTLRARRLPPASTSASDGVHADLDLAPTSAWTMPGGRATSTSATASRCRRRRRRTSSASRRA